MAHQYLMLRILISFVLAASSIAAVIADESSPSPAAERFSARKKTLGDEKRVDNRSAILAYLRRTKHLIERDWYPPTHTGSLATKVKLAINAKGKVSASLVEASSSKKEDKSVLGFLKGISLEPAPAGLDSIQLFLTFASGEQNDVAFSNGKEADDYYSEIMGVPLSTLDATGGADFGPYMADLQRRIKRCWFPPKGNESKRVVVQFRVDKKGDMSELRIEHGSGLAIAAQAALSAVIHAAPFRPLPDIVSESQVIQFTFDYNLFGGGSPVRFRPF